MSLDTDDGFTNIEDNELQQLLDALDKEKPLPASLLQRKTEVTTIATREDFMRVLTQKGNENLTPFAKAMTALCLKLNAKSVLTGDTNELAFILNNSTQMAGVRKDGTYRSMTIPSGVTFVYAGAYVGRKGTLILRLYADKSGVSPLPPGEEMASYELGIDKLAWAVQGGKLDDFYELFKDTYLATDKVTSVATKAAAEVAAQVEKQTEAGRFANPLWGSF